MSTRLQEDLRRIVGADDAGISMPRQEEKKPIPGGRGIVYFDNKGNSQVSSGTPPVVNEDGTVDPGTTQPGGDDSSGGTSGGGSNGGNTLPAGSEPAPIADGAEGGGVYSPDSDAGVIDANLGDTVKGVGGLVDCESGDPVDLRFDGEFSAPNGCSEAPEGYEEGFYWSTGAGPFKSTDPLQSCQDAYDASVYVGVEDFAGIQSVEGVPNTYLCMLGNGSGFTSVVRSPCGTSTEDYCTIPPPGTPTEPWPDANTPPNTEFPEGYEAGKFWGLSTQFNFPNTDPKSAIDAYLQDQADNGYPNLGGTPPYTTDIVYVTDIEYSTRVFQSTGGQVKGFQSYRYDCGASTEDYCTIPPPKQPDPNAKWPSCKPSQLSYNNETAKFETNQYDGNVLPKFSQPVSQVTLCNEAGDTIKTFPTADGGQVIFNQDNNIGVFLDDKGVVTGYGDGPAVTARQPR